MSSNNVTALARVEDIASRPLETIKELSAALVAARATANVLSPLAGGFRVKPLHQISLRVVEISLSECYQDKRFCDKDEYALGGVALQKLMAAAGAQVLGRYRLDDRSDPHYCEIEMAVAVQDFDGAWRQMIGTKELDLRDGAVTATGMQGGELANARKHIQSLAETKAMYRATRKLFNIKQKYHKDELARPWVVPKLVPHLDLSDPDQKAAAIAEATGRTTALFGPGPGDRKMRDVTPPPPALTAGEPAVDQVPAPHPPPPVGATRDVEDDVDEEQLDLLDVADPAKVPVFVCGCPCDCQAEVPENVANATQEAFGSIRCSPCAPGKNFDYGRHKDLATLQLKKYPKLTPDNVKTQLDAKAKAQPAGKR